MDMDLFGQLMCSDCGLVHTEALSFDFRYGSDVTCPRCGAGHDAIVPIHYVYDLTQAALCRY